MITAEFLKTLGKDPFYDKLIERQIEGNNDANITTHYFSDKEINKLITELKGNGFTVCEQEHMIGGIPVKSLYISW